MHRTQINLPDHLYLQLKFRAEQANKSLSQLIRESVEKYLDEDTDVSDLKQDPIWGILGMAESGLGNLAGDHDQYLYGSDKDENTGKSAKKDGRKQNHKGDQPL